MNGFMFIDVDIYIHKDKGVKTKQQGGEERRGEAFCTYLAARVHSPEMGSEHPAPPLLLQKYLLKYVTYNANTIQYMTYNT